jgi:hypothetical protein
MNRNLVGSIYGRGPPIDASYQASVHLAEGFTHCVNAVLDGMIFRVAVY